jgi:2-dehydro-3-deoxyphosphogluconate aldolase/(4S)-4-hydroxy-2-oxoglutarate aldolase
MCSENKPGAPFGDWVDMRGIRWRRKPEGGWARVVIAGAMTPTEVITAWQAGSELVKVFPCAPIGGPSYIKALRGPFPQVPMIAAGGVNQETAADFILAGAAALGIGGRLIPKVAVEHRKPEQISELARRFLRIVQVARNKPSRRN